MERGSLTLERLAVLSCVWGRQATTRLFYRGLERVLEQCERAGVPAQALVVGSERAVSEAPARAAGFGYLEWPNLPLGEKWNAGLAFLGELLVRPSYVLILDSDDLLSSRCVELYLEAMRAGVLYAGLEDLYFLDARSGRTLYWPGYRNHRAGEPAGTARLVARPLLELLGWQLYEPSRYKGLDYSMTLRLKAAGFPRPDRLLNLRRAGAVALDVKGPGSMFPFEGIPGEPAAIDYRSTFSAAEAEALQALRAGP